MNTPDSTIITMQLFLALLPSIGVLAFLLLNRRQHIRADLLDLHMRQEHRMLSQAQDTKKLEAVSQAMQAYAPSINAFVQMRLAKPSKPMTAADLSDEALITELRRRADGAFVDLECDACCDEDASNPIN